MDQVIVTLEGRDHKIGEDETTLCGIEVPHGTPRAEDQKPCKVCFAVDEPEITSDGTAPTGDEAPEAKPAKKATKGK